MQPDQAGSYRSGPDQVGSSWDEAVVDREEGKGLVSIWEVTLTGLGNGQDVDVGIKKEAVLTMTSMNPRAQHLCLEMKE